MLPKQNVYVHDVRRLYKMRIAKGKGRELSIVEVKPVDKPLANPLTSPLINPLNKKLIMPLTSPLTSPLTIPCVTPVTTSCLTGCGLPPLIALEGTYLSTSDKVKFKVAMTADTSSKTIKTKQSGLRLIITYDGRILMKDSRTQIECQIQLKKWTRVRKSKDTNQIA